MDTFMELISVLKKTRQEGTGISLYTICMVLEETLARDEIEYIIRVLSIDKTK